jgi:acetyltransferase
MELNKLFNPSSIAIVGASEEEGKVGNVIAKNILTLGYTGKVFLVNPKHETLFGQKCYKSLNEITDEVDLAVIIIPAKFVMAEISANADKIKNYVIISAGFSEIGEEGKSREAELEKLLTKKV